MSQDAFDRLLWDADLSFVRGEDSFVRAQWAGRAVRLASPIPRRTMRTG